MTFETKYAILIISLCGHAHIGISVFIPNIPVSEFGEAKSPRMHKHKIVRFVESFILLPAITVSGSISGLSSGGPIAATSQIVFSKKLNSNAAGEVAVVALAPERKEDFEALLVAERENKAAAIDSYFRVRGMPLRGLGEKFVAEAEKHGLDWRLLPAIAVRESTGGKFACKRVLHNPFGWNSCKSGFDSFEHAIEIVAKNLAGENPRTRRAYAGKDTAGILKAYNPPHVVANYAAEVMRIMNRIGPETISLASA